MNARILSENGRSVPGLPKGLFPIKMIKSFFVGLRLLILAGSVVKTSPAASNGFCALTVDLLAENGAPSRLTPVRLIDPSGKTVFDQQVDGPVVRICDFGFGPHKLAVGYGFCYPVTISNLDFAWADRLNSQ